MSARIEHLQLSLDEDSLQRLDQWRTEQDDSPTRAEAVRRLLRKALPAPGELTLTKPEKLMLSMLGAITKHLKIRDTSVDPDFLQEVLLTGNLWALTWNYRNLLNDCEEPNESEVSFVADVLEMWTALERAYDHLSKEDQAMVKENVTLPPLAKFLKFPGFDNNHEGNFASIVDFLVNKLDRFARFKNREFDVFLRMSEGYARMLLVYKPTQQGKMTDEDLTVSQIIAILKAWNTRAATV